MKLITKILKLITKNENTNNRISLRIFVVGFFVVSFLTLSFSIFVLSANAANGINRQINFQGKLVDNNGLNVADSAYTVVFSLYSTSSGGSAIWTESDSVTTKAGIFQVALGGQTSLPDDVYFNSDNLYLGIKVGADLEMTPRIRFTAVPYAINSSSLDGVTATQSATGFSLQGGTSTRSTLSFTTTAGALTFQPGVAEGLILDTNGANSLNLGTSANAITFGGSNNPTYLFSGNGGLTVNGTSMTLGNGSNSTIQTTGTNSGLTLLSKGSGNIVLGQNAGNGNVLINPNAGGQAGLIINDQGSGDLFTASAGGTTKFTLGNNGVLTFSGGEYIDDNTTADTLVLGSDGANGGVARVPVTNSGTAMESTVGAAGDIYYDSTASKFRCYQGTGWQDCIPSVNFQSTNGSNTITLTASEQSLLSGSITPSSTTGKIWVNATGQVTGDANNQTRNITVRIRRGSCTTGTQVGVDQVVSTTTTGDNHTFAVNFVDTPGSTASQTYNLCALTSAGSPTVKGRGMTIYEPTGSAATTGLGSLSVQNSDNSNTVSGVSSLDFGPLTSPTDQFTITDLTGGVAQVQLGPQVGLLNTAETATSVWNFSNGLGIGTSSPQGALDVRGNTATSPIASLSGSTTNAGLIIDNSGTGDILTASAGGVPHFIIQHNGAIVDSNYTNNGGLLYSTSGGVFNQLADVASGSCLTSGGVSAVPTWTACSGIGSNYFQLNAGAISPFSQTADLLVGGTSTTSAAFAFMNVSKNTPTASISAGLAGAVSLNATGTLATTNRQTLTIGGTTTGNIVIDPNSTNPVIIGQNAKPNAELDVRGTSATLPVSSISGQTAFSALVVDNTGLGDIFTASKSGLARFTITNSGGIRLGTADGSTGQCLTSNGAGSAVTWGPCGGGANTFQINNNTISQANTTEDLVLGGTSTASAKFAFIGTAGVATPVASISALVGSTAPSGLALSPSTLQSLNNVTLTIGGNTTGNITLSPLSGATGSYIAPSTINQVDLGTTSQTFRNIYAGTNVVVNGQSVCLQNNTNCPSQTSYWQVISNVISQGNSEEDLALGGTSTASAKFAFIGTAGVATPVASISAQAGSSAPAGLVLSPGNIQSLNKGTLTLGGATTGNIVIDSGVNVTQFADNTIGLTGTAPIITSTNALQINTGANTLTLNNSGSGAVQFFGAGNNIDSAGDLTLAGTITLPNSNTLTGATGLLQLSQGIAFGGSTTNQISNAGVANLASGTFTGTGNVLTLLGAGANLNFSGAGTAQILTANNQDLVLDPGGDGSVGINASTNLSAALDVRGNTATTPAASVAATSTFAGMVVNNSGTGDILTASKSGATKFTILNNGNIQMNNYNTDTGVLYTDGTGTIQQTGAGSDQNCLVMSGTTPIWGSCVTGGGSDMIQSVSALTTTTLAATSTLLGTVSITPTTTTGDVWVQANMWTNSLSNTNQTITWELRSGANCSGTLLTSQTSALTSASASDGPGGYLSYVTANPGTGTQQFAVCAKSGLASGASAGGVAYATVIDNTGPQGPAGPSEWQINGPVLSPNNNTMDLTIGGTSTASAKFAVLNMAGGTPTASLSAGVTGGAYMTASGVIQTTANQTLSLGGSTTGNIILNSAAGNYVGIDTQSPLATLDVRGALGLNGGTVAVASISGQTSYATLTAVNTGAGDLFTASKSGATKFTILNNGNIAWAGQNNVLSTFASAATSAQSWTMPNATGTLCLQGSTSCGFAMGTNYWQSLTTGAIEPFNTTYDLLLGGSATSSAKFAVLNMAGGPTTPVASLSAGTAGGAYFNATGTIQTTANQSLTLGGNTTGNILINPTAGNYLGIGTANPLASVDIRETTALNGGTIAVASVSGKTSFASLVVNNSGSGDLFTASSSGLTRFTVLQNGNVNIGTASAALAKYKLTVSDYQVATATALIANTAKNGQAFNACSGNNQSGCHTGLIVQLGQPGDSTVTNSGDVFEEFINGAGRRMGAIRGNNLAGIAYDTVGADYAEYFAIDPNVMPDKFTAADVAAIFPTGTLVCQDAQGVVPCDFANGSQILGVISEHPGFVGGEDGVNKVLVGLLGQLPVKVSDVNGAIKNGDNLAASGTPGVAVKATSAGAIVGRALEDFTNADGSGEGQVRAFVNGSWYDPMIPTDGNYDLLKNSDLSMFDSSSTASTSGIVIAGYTIKNGAGIAVTATTAFAKATIATIQAGAIVAHDISTDRLNVTTGNILIGGQTLDNYIKGIVKQTLSQSDQTGSVTVSVNGLVTASQSATLVQSLLDQHDLSATVSGMTVTGVLGADTINVHHIAGLSDLSVSTITAASISATTITADTISAKHIAGLEILESRSKDQEARIAALESLVATPSSAPVAAQEPTISPTEGITVLTTDTAEKSTVSGDLRVKGNGLIEGILHVADSLFANNFIANGVADFFGKVIFHTGVTFQETPTFTGDTAGIAVIKKGTDHIDVKFSKSYDQTPVINASITMISLTPTPSETLDHMQKRQDDLEKTILSDNIRYVVTKRTNDGFTIKLDQLASEDIAFSWLALSVQNPVIFQDAGKQNPTPSDSLTPSPIDSIIPTTAASMSARF